MFVLTFLITCLFSAANLNAASYLMHTVEEGETISEVAKDFEINSKDLESINNMQSSGLKSGSLLKIKQIKDIVVKVNGENVNFETQPYIENDFVFVPIRFVSEALGADSIDWNGETKSAVVQIGEKKIIVAVGSKTAKFDEQDAQLDAPVQFFNERVYVPLRFFSQAIGVDSIEWNQEAFVVDIKKSGVIKKEVKPEYSEEDLYWLSRIVQVEAGYEPFETKVAVANIIINRKKSSEFPNTIKGVIFDTKYGIQFPPAYNGKINKIPSEDSINAAKKTLEGYNNIGESLYFVDTGVKSSWVTRNRTYYKTIGNMKFYL